MSAHTQHRDDGSIGTYLGTFEQWKLEGGLENLQYKFQRWCKLQINCEEYMGEGETKKVDITST